MIAQQFVAGGAPGTPGVNGAPGKTKLNFGKC